MFGGDYILKVFGSNPNQIADELGLKRQSVYAWFKNKKIPGKRVDVLSNKFGVESKYFNMDLSLDDMRKIDEAFLNWKFNQAIEDLEDKRTHPYKNFGQEEMNELILNLYGKVLLDEKDIHKLQQKMNLLKDFLYLMLEIDVTKTVLWEIIDLLYQEIDGFKEDLFEVVDNYKEYL